MQLNINWTPPTPTPTCGFKILYAQKGNGIVQEIDLDSSKTSTSIPIPAPACYSGTIQSNCCGDVSSSEVPFGINAEVISSISAYPISGSTTLTNILFSVPYINPYDHRIDITINYNFAHITGSTHTNTVLTLPAGRTYVNQAVTLSRSDFLITSVVINSITPIFPTKGSIQYLDSVNTPPYFKIVKSSIPWSGSPINLASFTLDSYTVIDNDIDGNVIGVTYDFSFIADTVLSGSTFITAKVSMKSGDTYIPIGSTDVNMLSKGLRSFSVTCFSSSPVIDINNNLYLDIYDSSRNIIGTIYTNTFCPF